MFDSLSAQLQPNEREELLRKIRGSTSFSTEPFIPETEIRDDVDIDIEYERLGLFAKILIFFKCIFNSRDRHDVAEEYLVKRLAQNIQRDHPNQISVADNSALMGMYRNIETLQSMVPVFLTPLETALEGANQEFIIFLASFELTMLHQRLEDAVNPFTSTADYEDKTNEEIKKELEFRLEDLLMDVTEEQRKLIGRQIFTLEKLRDLCMFPYDKLLGRFSKRERDGQMTCSLGKLKDLLVELGNHLISLREPPEASTIHALFLFLYRKEVTSREEDIEEKLKRQFERTNIALQNIRHFYRNVPLIDILKYVLNDLNYYPDSDKGSGNWFTSYKNYWHESLDARYRSFLAERKKKQLISDAAKFLQEPVFPLLHKYRAGTHSLLFQPKYQYTLAFLDRFIKKYLGQKYKKELQTILIDGEFYKPQNRQDFTDAYNTLFQLEQRIQFIESSLSLEGGPGERIAAADRELIPKALKKKKIDTIVEVLERENAEAVRNCTKALTELYNVVNGILYGEVGGRYDTLSNLSYLGGSDNKGFKSKLDSIISIMSEAKEQINNLSTIEG